MKTRQGFVSNSSTTSFCILYKDAKIEDVGKKDIYIYMEIGVGMALFQAEGDMVEYIQKHPNQFTDADFYHVYSYFSEGEGKLDKPIPEIKGLKVKVDECQQWQPESAADLKEFIYDSGENEEDDED
jgi:hypothetical protein